MTNSKDNLHGFIDYKERNSNPVSVVFKSAMTDTEKTYDVKDCAGYGLDGLESYERFVVDISLSQIHGSRLTVGLDTSFVRQVVFLKVLQRGQFLNLYSYTDVIKERFYILEANFKEPVELINGMYLSDDWKKTIVVSNKYVRQLFAVATKHKKADEINEARFLSLAYHRKDMLKAVSGINGITVVKARQSSSRFFAGIDLLVTNANYLDKEFIAYEGAALLASSPMKSKSVYTPMLNMGVDWFLNSRIRRLIFRAELSAMMSKHKFDGVAEGQINGPMSHTFEMLNVAISPQGVYNIYNADRTRLFIGVGLTLNLSNYLSNKITRPSNFGEIVSLDPIPLEKAYFSLQGTAGVVFHEKIEVFIGYSPSAPISNYAITNINIQRTRMGVRYLFGKN